MAPADIPPEEQPAPGRFELPPEHRPSLTDSPARLFGGIQQELIGLVQRITPSPTPHGGAGLGTLGLHEAKLRELCSHAGSGTVRQVPIDNPVNRLYEVRP